MLTATRLPTPGSLYSLLPGVETGGVLDLLEVTEGGELDCFLTDFTTERIFGPLNEVMLRLTEDKCCAEAITAQKHCQLVEDVVSRV